MNSAGTPTRRVDIRAVLADPVLRRRLLAGVIVATQARGGITTTVTQAEAAYDQVQRHGLLTR